MEVFRLKSAEVEGVQIDKEWQQFLLKEHNMDSNIGDYYYKDIQGVMRTMAKDRFERLFMKVDEYANQQNWLQKLIPSMAT